MISNYKEFKAFLNNLEYKPNLLLHACCAPCSSHCLFILKNYFNITIFFSNDNIFPSDEYFKRYDELKKFVNEYDENVNVVENGYNPDDYYKAILGKENLGEKSLRCYECYKLRMEKACLEAKKLKIEYFTTTLSLSPHKNSIWINEIGFELEKKYGIKYLYSDFKKENGYLDSINLSKEYSLYRQNYCGCEFSLKEMNQHDRIKKEN